MPRVGRWATSGSVRLVRVRRRRGRDGARGRGARLRAPGGGPVPPSAPSPGSGGWEPCHTACRGKVAHDTRRVRAAPRPGGGPGGRAAPHGPALFGASRRRVQGLRRGRDPKRDALSRPRPTAALLPQHHSGEGAPAKGQGSVRVQGEGPGAAECPYALLHPRAGSRLVRVAPGRPAAGVRLVVVGDRGLAEPPGGEGCPGHRVCPARSCRTRLPDRAWGWACPGPGVLGRGPRPIGRFPPQSHRAGGFAAYGRRVLVLGGAPLEALTTLAAPRGAAELPCVCGGRVGCTGECELVLRVDSSFAD